MALFLAGVALAGLKKVGGGLIKRAVGGGARKLIGGAAKGIIGAAAASGAVSAAGGALTRWRGGVTTTSFVPPQGVPRPREGPIGRRISQILPGGMSGREFTPVNDMTDRTGRPIAVYPETVEQTRGPSGYVVVTNPSTGDKIAMLRHFAIRAGLYDAPPKPPVSGYDMRAINRAASARKRVKKLASKVGFACKTRGRGKAC